MLRIGINGSPGSPVTVRLEGRVVGAWVAELESACRQFLDYGDALTLDLADVDFIDRDGLALFRRLRGHHAMIRNCSPFVAEQLREVASC